MKLYQSIGPNPRVATMFIAEAGLTVPRALVDIRAGENRQPAYLAKNPLGGTPLLELDDGNCIADSVAIAEYLDALTPGSTLIGATPADRAVTCAMLRHIDQTVVVPMTTGFRGAEGYPMFKDRMHCVPGAADDLKALTRAGLAGVDTLLTAKTFLLGDRFTLADILLFAFVEFGAVIGQPTPPELANLAAWRDRVAARPSVAVSADPLNGL